MSHEPDERAEKLRALRADLQAGIASLDAGKGGKLDMQELIKRLHAQNAER
jgi:hypothetical protein